jgi:tRNA (cmo5U34)-methyltransferase
MWFPRSTCDASPGPDPYDKPSSLPDHLGWLRETGFTEVDLAWLYACHAIVTARRRREARGS